MCISKPYRSITFIFICSAHFRYVPTLISQKLIIRNQFHHTYFGKWQKVRVEKAKQNLIFTPEENSAWFLKRMPKVRSSTSGHQYPPSLAASKARRGKILKMKVRRVTKSGAPKIDGSTTRITFHTMYRNGFQRPCTWLTWAHSTFETQLRSATTTSPFFPLSLDTIAPLRNPVSLASAILYVDILAFATTPAPSRW